MERGYTALQVVSVLYRLAAGLIFFGAILVGGFTAISPSMSYDFVNNRITQGPPLVLPGIGIIVAGVILAVSLFAFGQLIDLLIDLELNTRKTAELLNRRMPPKPTQDAPQLKRMGQGEPPSEP